LSYAWQAMLPRHPAFRPCLPIASAFARLWRDKTRGRASLDPCKMFQVNIFISIFHGCCYIPQ